MRNTIALLFVIGLIIFSGCSTPERTAYRSIGSIAVSVDASMQAWGDYVRAGYATDAQQASVKQAYEVYQAAMIATHKAVVIAKAAPEGQATYQTAINASAAAASDVIDLVRKITKK